MRHTCVFRRSLFASPGHRASEHKISGTKPPSGPLFSHGSVNPHIRHRHRWPTLAHWLNRNGFRCTLVNKSPALRTGGYVIDFWGLGYEIAEKMRLLSEMMRPVIT